MTDVPPEPPSSEGSAGDPFEGPEWTASGTLEPGAERERGTRVKISRRRKRKLRRMRRLGWVFVGAGALIVAALAWIAITGLMARSQLEQARAEVATLRRQVGAGDLAAARHTAAGIAAHAARAHQLTTGPAWAVAAALPGAGPVKTVRGIAEAVDRLGSDVLPLAVTASEQLDPATLRDGSGRVNVARIAAVAPTLQRAADVMAAVTASVQHLPTGSWLSSVDDARSSLLHELDGLDHTLNSARLAARVVPAMLGQHGTQRYFVAFQNDAEARGTGGLPGAFAIVSATDGKIRFERFENDGTLLSRGLLKTHLDLGADYDQLYDGANTTTDYRNSNLSPNFPYAGRIWLAMWQAYSGQRLDGAIAVDPTALSYLLAVTGPATLPDGSTVSAANVVALTQSTVYQRFRSTTPAGNAARKAYLLQVAKAASSAILDAHGRTKALVEAAGRAAGERRLLVWSADPAVEQLLEQTSVSGEIPETRAPYVGLSIVNDGGNKLDYYLDRSLTWTRSGCGRTRQVRVTIRLTNNAPASGLPAYVTARSDQHSYPVKPGDNRLEVSYLATAGAQLESVTVDGRPGTAGAGTQRGHPLYTVDLELPRGTTRTVVLSLREPAGSGSPVVLRQPLVRPLTVTLHDVSCG